MSLDTWWFAFCHVFTMSVTYEIPQNDFDVNFLYRKFHSIGENYFEIKTFSKYKNICLHYKVSIIFLYRNIFFFKKLHFKYLIQEKSSIIVLLTNCFVLYYLCESKISSHLMRWCVQEILGVKNNSKLMDCSWLWLYL